MNSKSGIVILLPKTNPTPAGGCSGGVGSFGGTAQW